MQLKHDLEIPAQHIEQSPDLPVSEILTSSLPAFRHFVEAGRARAVSGDMEAAARYLETAVEADPQFALAYLMLWSMYLSLNRMDEGERALQAGMQVVYKLPERTQFQFKSVYYWLIKQDINKALTAAGMHAELYPEDTEAHLNLANFYEIKAEHDRAISALERALELDPERIDILSDIGDIYEAMGEFPTALDYFRRYSAAAPNDPAAFTRIGDLQRLRGEHEAARQQYERALVVDPNNAVALTRVADIEGDLGRFPRALAGYEEALAASVTAEQRAGVYESLASHYELRGQPSRAIHYKQLHWSELEEYGGPFIALQYKLQDLDIYVDAGLANVARDTLRSIAAQLNPAFESLLPLGQLAVYLALEQADSIEVAVAGLERLIETFGLEAARSLQVYAQGRVLEIRGDCREAIVSYQRALQLEPRQPNVQLDLGRCHRKLGQLAEAETQLQGLLDVRPFDPQAHYELALVYADMAARGQTLEHLRTALDVWEDADPAYRPAQRAREKLAELTQAS